MFTSTDPVRRTPLFPFPVIQRATPSQSPMLFRFGWWWRKLTECPSSAPVVPCSLLCLCRWWWRWRSTDPSGAINSKRLYLKINVASNYWRRLRFTYKITIGLLSSCSWSVRVRTRWRCVGVRRTFSLMAKSRRIDNSVRIYCYFVAAENRSPFPDPLWRA